MIKLYIRLYDQDAENCKSFKMTYVSNQEITAEDFEIWYNDQESLRDTIPT